MSICRSFSSSPFRVELNILADHIINLALHLKCHIFSHPPSPENKLNKKKSTSTPSTAPESKRTPIIVLQYFLF